MANFSVYFDDGGHPLDQIAVLVAGFIATEEQWLRFEDEWRRALAPFNIPELHMTDFEASKDWSRNEKDRLLGDLVSIIKRRTRYHISHIVPMKEYRGINEERAFEEMMGTPFAIAGRTAARSVNDWKKRYTKPDDKLRVFFEDGTLHKGDFMEAMKRDELPCPLFVKKTVRLESADLFAWELLHTLKVNRIRYSLHELLGNHPGDDGYYEGRNLLDLATKIPVPAPLRASLNPSTKLYHHSHRPKDPEDERYFERRRR